MRFELPLGPPSEPVRLAVPTDGQGTTTMRLLGRVELPDTARGRTRRLVAGAVRGRTLPAATGRHRRGHQLRRRPLRARHGEGRGPGSASGSLVVDLNFLYHPSCRYNPAWQCPLAPAGERDRGTRPWRCATLTAAPPSPARGVEPVRECRRCASGTRDPGPVAAPARRVSSARVRWTRDRTGRHPFAPDPSSSPSTMSRRTSPGSPRELTRRFGSDYRIVCAAPATRPSTVLDDAAGRARRGRGRPRRPVAARHHRHRPAGPRARAPPRREARAPDPMGRLGPPRRPPRPCCGRWRSGRIDCYVLKPWCSPDELFHRTVAELVHEWSRSRPSGGGPITVVGQRHSPRTSEVRSLLTRNGVPHTFRLADTDEGRAILARPAGGHRAPGDRRPRRPGARRPDQRAGRRGVRAADPAGRPRRRCR